MTEAKRDRNEDLPSDEALYKAVLAFVRRRERDREAAADLVQEVFCRLAAQVPAIAPEKRRAWLYQTARRLLVDRIRRNATEKKALTHWDAMTTTRDNPTPDQLLQRQEESELVLQLVNRLDAEHQEVIRLKFQEGLSYQEIAEVMNKPKTTIAWLLHESLVELREGVAHV
ncbi:MAG: sigma-70 family RNA polymerase sigma factor [Planctomycetia bacterium]|nr:sigma-70 family RNA polymerase sigma factor [Planctomycetia bacterium]